jgi:uncharacterized caspase-like protein
MRPIRTLSLLLFFILLCSVPITQAATEQRIALVIGNSSYSSAPLKNPVNDAADMAALLKKLGFSVTLKKNARLQEMDEAIETFGNRLKKGGVGLFYYAGHGVQVNGVNYLLPIGAKINKEADVKYQAVDANKILDEMATANNGLNIVMLDACRDNPFARSFRSAARGLAIVSSAPSGIFLSYSTSPGNVARDGDGRNSPYTAALLKYMQAPGLTISDVFINVRMKLKKETGQVPWELSSLEGQFYFVPGSEKTAAGLVGSAASIAPATDELDDESQKLEAEQRRLEDEKAEFTQKTALEEKRRKLAEDRARFETERQQAALELAKLSEAKKEKETIFKGVWRSSGGWVYRCDGEQFVVVSVSDKQDTALIDAVMFRNMRKEGDKWKADNASRNYRTGELVEWIEATFEVIGKNRLIRRNRESVITLERIE